jgi:hypothetical protein
MSFDLSNYVDAKTRVQMLYEKYPDASIQFEFKGIMPNNPEQIWGVATVWRSAADERPITGTASELAKGKTSFTAGSELMNLETSAVARACGFLNIGITNSLASKDEVEFAKERQRVIPTEETYDPWEADKMGTLEQALTSMGAVPECACGVAMKHVQGVGKTGRPYSGFVCANKVKEHALWDK